MKVTTLNDPQGLEAVNGTSLKGYVVATRSELEKALGAPTWNTPSPDGKITTEWVLRFSDDTVATIYDWKRYEEGAPEMDERIEWHIGGHTNEVLLSVERCLGIASRGWRI